MGANGGQWAAKISPSELGEHCALVCAMHRKPPETSCGRCVGFLFSQTRSSSRAEWAPNVQGASERY